MRTCLLFLIVLSISCNRDPAERRAQAERTLHAWTETMNLAARQWINREVPSRYLRQTIDAARKAIEKAKSDAPEVAPRADRFDATLSRIDDALQRDDREAARAQIT